MRHRLTSVMLVVCAFALASAATASATLPPQTTVYSNIPDETRRQLRESGLSRLRRQPSSAVRSELGSGSRTNPVVTVTMSSWACQKGNWPEGSCATTPGARSSQSRSRSTSTRSNPTTRRENWWRRTRRRSRSHTGRPPIRSALNPAHGSDAKAWLDESGRAVLPRSRYEHQVRSRRPVPVSLPDKVIVVSGLQHPDDRLATSRHAIRVTDGCAYDSLNMALTETG